MKLGAYHYITKDFEYDAVVSLVRNASDRTDLHRKVMALSAQVADDRERPFVTGPSRSMRDILDLVRKVAALDATVLILGESGTGKELLARMIHRESGRADGPFMPVNLAAIPSELVESALFGHEKGAFTGAVRQQLGKFELADGGTLFLDEIGELKPDVQAKLLRAIQESEIERVGGGHPIRVDLRIIAATNVDIEKAVREGRFREDLVLPHQRHPDDGAAAARADGGHPGPGAVLHRPLQRQVPEEGPRRRALRHGCARRLPVAGQHPRAREPDGAPRRRERRRVDPRRGPALRVPPGKARQAGPGSARACSNGPARRSSATFILKALEQARWNVSATARNLGVPLSTLKLKMERLDIRDIARRLKTTGPA